MKTFRLYLMLTITLLALSPFTIPSEAYQDKKQSKFDEAYQQANKLYDEQKYKDAAEFYKKASTSSGAKDEDKAAALYRLSCCYALLNDKTKAIDSLKQAVSKGFKDADQISSEKAFDTIKEDETFKKILKGITPPPSAKAKTPTVKKIGAINKSPGGGAWDGAYELQTDHFTIHIDVPEEDGIKAAQNLEYLLDTMCKVLNMDKSKWTERKPCYLFKDIKKFQQVRNSVGGPGMAVHGWADSSGKLYCYVNGRGYAGLYWTYLHEGCHLILNVLLGDNTPKNSADYWVVEGIACYMGSLKNKGDGTFTFGKENHSMLKKTYENKKEQVAEMISWNEAKFYGKPDRGNYYVVGYGVCHYLFNVESGRYKNRFGEYIKTIYQGGGSAGVFEKTIGISPKDIQEKLKGYIKELK
ncbi:MAG: hypothetical protein A2W23_06120 [Planctomycetes bacterium RBG_16_43_13]|nr:MAG: hypothetical protein A2W23_06120 [Planctomycetes bacterium RBG_16_43_13]